MPGEKLMNIWIKYNLVPVLHMIWIQITCLIPRYITEVLPYRNNTNMYLWISYSDTSIQINMVKKGYVMQLVNILSILHCYSEKNIVKHSWLGVCYDAVAYNISFSKLPCKCICVRFPLNPIGNSYCKIACVLQYQQNLFYSREQRIRVFMGLCRS